MCRCALQIVISELTRLHVAAIWKTARTRAHRPRFFGNDVTVKFWPTGLNITEGQLAGSRQFWSGHPALQRQLWSYRRAAATSQSRRNPVECHMKHSHPVSSEKTKRPLSGPVRAEVCLRHGCVEDSWVPSCSLTSKQMTAPWAWLCLASVNVCVCLSVHVRFVSGLWFFIACSHLRLGNHTEKTGKPFLCHSSHICIKSDQTVWAFNEKTNTHTLQKSITALLPWMTQK